MSFERKYPPAQRDAITRAWAEGMRPAARIAALAAAGELEPDLEPFEIPVHSVRSMGARALRRARIERARLAVAPDAPELMRRRLLGALQIELDRIDAAQRARRPPKDLAVRIRETARAAREVSALQAASGASATNASERSRSGRSRVGGLAAAIVRANESGASPALEPAEGDGSEPLPVSELLLHPHLEGSREKDGARS